MEDLENAATDLKSLGCGESFCNNSLSCNAVLLKNNVFQNDYLVAITIPNAIMQVICKIVKWGEISHKWSGHFSKIEQ